jgi:hypothetical protein
MDERDLRELCGVPADPQVTFLGESYAIQEDGLVALIRFARAATTDNPEQPVPLTAVYRLLEDCLTDFGAFAARALASRAEMSDITPVMNELVSWYCARSHWPAMRLIGYVAGNLDELDGQLLRAGGRGILSLSAREACNLALATCLDGRGEDDREVFMTDLDRTLLRSCARCRRKGRLPRMADVTVEWNDGEADQFLTAVEEYLMPHIADEVHWRAEALAPVRIRRTPVPKWAKLGYVGVSGRLKASVVVWDGVDSGGRYWNVGALWYGRFMDPKARQLHYLRPFLVTALRETVEGRVYHLG